MADPKNPLEMSDDEISNMSSPPAEPEAQKEETAEEKATREAAEAEAANAEADSDNSDNSEGGDQEDDAEDDDESLTDAEKAARAEDEDEGEPELDADGKPIEKKSEVKPEDSSVGSKEKPAAPTKDSGQEEITLPGTPELEQFYKDLMTPFKANGKMIELKSPQEVRQLMQMGANYTKKLQDIQPHRKVILMLQNNGLLDEGKLSFLIDLDKRDPEAIKKLVKESGIDPLEIDTTTDTAYRPGNHSVTDEEANFRTTMSELVSSSSEGKETVAEIYDNWDDTSKEVLWKEPQLLSIIHEQRETGVYTLIKTEVDRRKTLGTIPANTPFFEAYNIVGQEMVEATLGPDGKGKPKTDVKRDVLTTRAAAPKSKVANGDKADAASPTKASGKAAKVLVNPLALSDDEFLKQMENRL